MSAVKGVPTESLKRCCGKVFCEEGKDGEFLAPKVFARSVQAGLQLAKRFGKVFGGCRLPQVLIDLLMVLIEPVELACFCHGVIECGIGEVFFVFGMLGKHAGQQAGEQLDFGDRLHLWQETFQLVQEPMEQGVLGSEGVGNCGHAPLAFFKIAGSSRASGGGSERWSDSIEASCTDCEAQPPWGWKGASMGDGRAGRERAEQPE